MNEAVGLNVVIVLVGVIGLVDVAAYDSGGRRFDTVLVIAFHLLRYAGS